MNANMKGLDTFAVGYAAGKSESSDVIKVLVEALKTCRSDWADGCYGTMTERDYDSEKVSKALKLAS